jgi:hypothetical protein
LPLSVKSALNQHFNLNHHSKRYAKILIATFIEVRSKPAFQSWFSCKTLYKDAHCNFSVKSSLNQHFILDYHGNSYPKMHISTPLCLFLSINISIVDFHAKSYRKMLFSNRSRFLLSSNFSILNIMQNVIKKCSFPLICAVCSQSIFQSWSSIKTLSKDVRFNSSVMSAFNQHFNLGGHANVI